MPFRPDNIESWFCCTEADFHEHGMNDKRAQFLAVVKALPRELNRYVTPSMFTSDVSEPYETLKRSILKREDLTDRQRLDQLFNSIDLQHGSATDMLKCMREVISLKTFEESLSKQCLLSKLPQQVQAVLVSFRNNALDELAASADRILEITKSSTTEVFSVNEKPQTAQNNITELCHTLTPAKVSQWTDALPLGLLAIRNAVKADIEYTVTLLVYGTTLRLPGEIVDPSSSSMNMDPTSYTNRLTNAMRSVKPASTRPQSTDVFVQLDLRFSTLVVIRRDLHRRPFESVYDGPFKVPQREYKYYIVDKNERNDSISIDRLKAVYLEGNPIHVDFPSVQSHNTTPTLIIFQPTGETHDDTSIVSENKLKTMRSGRRVRFSEH
ncbi:unnamed protein product [Schistosoma margrebowiei]|uniref:DUF7041 domain-containing protein n=1 Tax=Schistosoma margrebowiei TaxID=48269 RepID=A0A183MIR5_9TREM|nr:unnamed protein product [Schistosoma margrebowiei]